jgi:hypothetical protein
MAGWISVRQQRGECQRGEAWRRPDATALNTGGTADLFGVVRVGGNCSADGQHTASAGADALVTARDGERCERRCGRAAGATGGRRCPAGVSWPAPLARGCGVPIWP